MAEHTYFEMGTFHYLANDPKVPQAIRDNYQKYGLCKVTACFWWPPSSHAAVAWALPRLQRPVLIRGRTDSCCARAAQDEFQDYGHIPPQLYIRISNRLVGETVLTQNNICVSRVRNRFGTREAVRPGCG